MGPHYLDRLFAPNAVAVFGASERPGAIGTHVFRNIVDGGFAGPVYPVNPKHARVGGHTCYPDIAAAPTPVDLAVITTPAATVPGIIRECGDQGVRAVIVHSAGFTAETPGGAQLQKAMLEEARRYNLRILGPNCLGFIRPAARLNATFSRNAAAPGSLALVSQSGGLCTAILDWAEAHGIGFSAMVSLGGVADVDFGDVLDYLALDPHTESILLYVEGIYDARRFMSGLRIAARMKPVVVVKAGRHAEGLRAAMSHTGALVGADDVFDAALARAGAVRAMTIEQLFAAAQLLATHRRVRGSRLAIITNGGGPGVMATDRAIDLGLAIPELEPATLARLDQALPAQWSHGNPVDILGDATPERYQRYLRAQLRGLEFAPLAFVSARTGFNVAGLLDLARSLHEQAGKRVSTADVNRVLDAARERQLPHRRGKRLPKVFYGTQVGVYPPTFVIFVNDPGLFDERYGRYFENRLRDAFPFAEVPLKVEFRSRGPREPRRAPN